MISVNCGIVLLVIAGVDLQIFGQTAEADSGNSKLTWLEIVHYSPDKPNAFLIAIGLGF
jgi:hypothetical protein